MEQQTTIAEKDEMGIAPTCQCIKIILKCCNMLRCGPGWGTVLVLSRLEQRRTTGATCDQCFVEPLRTALRTVPPSL